MFYMTISSPAQASNMQQLQVTRNVGTDFIASWILVNAYQGSGYHLLIGNRCSGWLALAATCLNDDVPMATW